MNDQLRLSDADRDRAAAALGDHYAEGRLDADEHAERLERVWAARTAADLRPVFRDLPSGGPARPARPARPVPWAGRRPAFPPLVPVLLVLVALTVLTHVPFVLLGVVALVLLSRRRRHGAWRAWPHGGPPRG